MQLRERGDTNSEDSEVEQSNTRLVVSDKSTLAQSANMKVSDYLCASLSISTVCPFCLTSIVHVSISPSVSDHLSVCLSIYLSMVSAPTGSYQTLS